jgi:hypothetical protein
MKFPISTQVCTKSAIYLVDAGYVTKCDHKKAQRIIPGLRHLKFEISR